MIEKLECRIEASLDPARSEIVAKASLNFRTRVFSETLALQIHPNLKITHVRFQERECDFRQTPEGMITVDLSTEALNTQQSLDLDYVGCLAAEEPERTFIGKDFFWLRDDQYWYPLPIVEPQDQMEKDPFPIHPGNYTVQMRLPLGWDVAASSPLIGRWKDDEGEFYTWDTRGEYPGMSIVGGKLEKHSNNRCTFLWETPGWDLAETVQDMLDFCEEVLGPFTHFGLSIIVGAGFAPSAYADRGLICIRESRLNLRSLIHELVHQWWGRGVLVKYPWDRWLTEGLAEYLSLIYLESKNKLDLGKTLEEYKASYLQTVSTWGDKPLITHVSNKDYQKKGLVGALLYKKGAWLHRMLHFILQDRYFEALRRIHPKYQGKFITTHQYAAELMDICKGQRESIEAFVQQWLHSPSMLKLRVEIVEKRQVFEGIELTFAIHQVEQVYHLPLEIEIRTTDSRNRERVWLSQKRTVFKKVVTDNQCSIVIDPDCWIMKQIIC